MTEHVTPDANASLGDIASLTRFRPLDTLDFSRRAKNLSKLLKTGLQETQELLARAYGYAGLHEIQTVLKQEGLFGPFEDLPLALPSAALEARAELRFNRDARLMREIDEWRWKKKDHYSFNRDDLACDLGLFSTPSAHRVCTSAVWDFIESETGYSNEGFPFGFRGAIHSRYRWRLPLEKHAFAELNGASDRRGFTDDVFDPQKQLDILRRYRAPHLFLAMVEETARDALAEREDDIELDMEWFDGDELERLLQCNFDDLIAHHLAMQSMEAGENDTDEIRHRLLLEVIAEPTEERVQANLAQQDVVNFRENLARWRMSLRIQLATLLRENEYDEFDDDFNGPPAVVPAGQDDRIMTLMLRPLYNGGLNFEHWRVCGALLLQDSETEKWSVAGSLSGDFIHPSSKNVYESPESVASYFDDQGNGELLRVWQLLQSMYFNRADYVDYSDWVNDGFGVALANLNPWVSPKHRGTEAITWLFEDFVAAFEECAARTWDADWRGWIGPDIEEGSYYDDDPEVMFLPPSVVFVPLPDSGVLGYSVWDGNSDVATGKVLMSGGERVSRTSRSRKLHEAEIEKKGIGWRLVDVVKATPADFVFYDPYLKT